MENLVGYPWLSRLQLIILIYTGLILLSPKAYGFVWWGQSQGELGKSPGDFEGWIVKHPEN